MFVCFFVCLFFRMKACSLSHWKSMSLATTCTQAHIHSTRHNTSLYIHRRNWLAPASIASAVGSLILLPSSCTFWHCLWSMTLLSPHLVTLHVCDPWPSYLRTLWHCLQLDTITPASRQRVIIIVTQFLIIWTVTFVCSVLYHCYMCCVIMCNILYCSKVDDQPTFTWVPNDMSLQSFKPHAHSFIGVKRWSGLKVQDYKVNKTFAWKQNIRVSTFWWQCCLLLPLEAGYIYSFKLVWSRMCHCRVKWSSCCDAIQTYNYNYMILRLLIKASGQIHDIYGGVHMHMGHSHSAIVDSYLCYGICIKKICTLINLHVMQLKLPL